MMSWNPKHVKNGVMLFIVVFYIVERHTCIFHWNVFLQSNIFLNKQIRLKAIKNYKSNIFIIKECSYNLQKDIPSTGKLLATSLYHICPRTNNILYNILSYTLQPRAIWWLSERGIERARERMDGNELFAFVSE